MNTSKARCWKCALLVAALLPIVGGCTRASNVSGEQVFEYEPRVALTTLVVGLMAIPLACKLWKRALPLAFCMFLLGPIAAGIFAPSMFLARVVVGRDQFQVRNGMWWAMSVRTFKFAEIERIGLTRVITVGRRGRKRTNEYLSCYDKLGQSSRVSIDNPITRAAVGAILREASAQGVRIGGARGNGIPSGPGGRTNLPEW